MADSRVRPPLTANSVEAPPWLVADNFVIEHVTHEHMSVVLEPDYVKMVRVAQNEYDERPPANARAAGSFSDSSATAVIRPPGSRTVSIFNYNTIIILYNMLYYI